MAQQFPQSFGPYTLDSLIARGGMAEIYKARMLGIGSFEKVVAIKKILPHLTENDEFITMLIDEAKLLVGLNHANIAQVYDLGKIDDSYYIAMEFVHGMDVAEMIKAMSDKGLFIPFEHVAYITSCLCMGLHVAHHAVDGQGRPLGIVHRDISPHNVLVSFAGDVKVIDFGVAKARSKEQHTKAGVIKGKLLYMAPEQAMAKDIDGRADLFAAGLCMYKMLTQRLPFEGDNEFQIYNNILTKEIEPPKLLNPNVPEELNQICMTLLQRDPDRRYQDGYSAKRELDRAMHNLAPGYTPSRLSRFIEDKFEDVIRKKIAQANGQAAASSTPVPAPAPSTPAPAQPSFGSQPASQGGGFQGFGAGFPAGAADTSDTVEHSSPFGPGGAAASMQPPGFGERVRTDAPVAPHGGAPQPIGFGPSPNTPAFGAPAPQPTPDGGLRAATSSGKTGEFDTASLGSAPAPAGGGVDKKTIALVAVVVLMGLVMVGMGAAVFLMEDEPSGEPTEEVDPGGATEGAASSAAASAAADEPAEVEAAPVRVSVEVKSTPTGATILNGADELGETPLTFEVMADALPLKLTVEADGHAAHLLEVTESATSFDVALEAREGGEGGEGGEGAPEVEDSGKEAAAEDEPPRKKEDSSKKGSSSKAPAKKTTKKTTKTTKKKESSVDLLFDDVKPKKTTKKTTKTTKKKPDVPTIDW
jgi:serine/threonine protein kinase